MRSPDGRLWSAALPLLTLAALFGMHGLGDHTGAHAAEVGHHAMAMTPASPSDHSSDHLAEPTPSPRPSPAAVVPLGTGSSMGMTLLCLGVLVGAGLALLVLARAGTRSGWDAPRQVRQVVPRPHCRDPDPPSRLVLSVHRC